VISRGSDDIAGAWPQVRDPAATARRLLIPVLGAGTAWTVFTLAGPSDLGRGAEVLRGSVALVLMIGVFAVQLAGLVQQRLPYRGPVGLIVRPETFAGWPYPQPAYVALQASLTLTYAAIAGRWGWSLLTQAVGPGPLRYGFVMITADLGVLLIAVVLAGSVIVASALIAPGRPRLELTRRGVVSRELLGSRTFPWDAFDPREAATVTPTGQLVLAVDRAAVVRTGLSTRSTRLSWPYRSVSAPFVARAVTYYVHQPHRRDGIGTADGYADLLAAAGAPTED
jgi:hypothetical protein